IPFPSNVYERQSVVFRAGWVAREEQHRPEFVNHTPDGILTKFPQMPLKMKIKMTLGLCASGHAGATVRIAHHTDSLSQYPDITVNTETRRLITLLTPKKLIFL